MAPELDALERGRLRGREHRDLDARVCQLLQTQRLKSRVLAGRRGQLLDGEIERGVGFDASDAAAQLARHVEADEDGARFEQGAAVRRARRQQPGRQVLAQGGVRDPQQFLPVTLGEC